MPRKVRKLFFKRGTTLAERFKLQCGKRTKSGCLLWNGSRDNDGYGVLYSGPPSNRYVKAHRLAYQMHHGPIPDGASILHSCDNPSCVEPTHLRAGSHVDNMVDRKAAGKYLQGQDNPSAKLTNAQVRQIRKRYRRGLGVHLAKEYGVTVAVICGIARGVMWKTVL